MSTNIFPSRKNNITNIITKKKPSDHSSTNETMPVHESDNDSVHESDNDSTIDNILQSSTEEDIESIDHDHENITGRSILDILEQNEHSSKTLIKKNKNGLYSLNTYDELFFKKYKDRLIRKKEIYVVSSELFQKKSLFLTIPCILITCMMSIISFLSASTYFTENTRIILSLVVGSLGSIGTLCQSFQSTLNYNTKAEAFRNAAEKYDKLITKIKFEIYNHNEHDFIDKLEKDVLKISSTCKYFPPQSVKNLIVFNDKYVNKVTHLIEKYDVEHGDKKSNHKNNTIRNINDMRITIEN